MTQSDKKIIDTYYEHKLNPSFPHRVNLVPLVKMELQVKQ